MKEHFLIITLIVACCFSANTVSAVFFDEKFETGSNPFSFNSYNDNIMTGGSGLSSNHFTGERVYDSAERGYVWKNTFHRYCNDSPFGHRKRQDADWNITNTFHWRVYIKFGDSDNSPEWATSAPVSGCNGITTQRSYELKFPDIGGGGNLNLGRIIGKFRSFPGGRDYQGVFRLYTPDGTNHDHTDQGTAPFVSNRWYAVEFMVEDNGNNDTVKIWINNDDPNNPDYSYTGGNMFNSSQWSTGMRWDHGYKNHTVSRDTNVYYDDVVISDSFIGLGTDDPVLPPEPNLSENSYVVVNPRLVSASVVSLADNNVITAGEVSLNLDLYETGAFHSNTGTLSPGVVITGTGPFDIGSDNNGTDMPLHASMLGTSFAMPHTRYSHIYHMMSPHDNARVNIEINGEHHQMDLSRGAVRTFDAGETNGQFGAVITSDAPILLNHMAHNHGDVSPIPPAATELWGVRTRSAYVTAVEDDTHVTLYANDGVRTSTMTLQAGEKSQIDVGLNWRQAAQGAGSAVHLVADKPISAVQFADGDGIEQTAFYPTYMLNQRFGIPIDTQYIAIVCSEPDTTITLYRPNADPVTRTCSADGDYPAKVFFGRSDANVVSIPQGSYLESTKPIHMIYEVARSGDEHNLIGTSAQVGISAEPLFSSDMEGSNPAGSWSDVRREERGGNATITFVSDGDSQVAQFNYHAGNPNNVWFRENFGSHHTVNAAPVDELWINFEYKVNDTAIYNPNRNRTNKILLVNWSNPNNHRRSFQVQLGAYHNGSGHVLGLEKAVFNRGTGAWEQGQFLGEFDTTHIPSNEKLYLQLHIRNSTNGEENGVVELYKNGEIIVEQRNVALNDFHGDHPDHVILTSYISDSNGQVDGFAQYDNINLYVTDPGSFRSPR